MYHLTFSNCQTINQPDNFGHYNLPFSFQNHQSLPILHHVPFPQLSPRCGIIWNRTSVPYPHSIAIFKSRLKTKLFSASHSLATFGDTYMYKYLYCIVFEQTLCIILLTYLLRHVCAFVNKIK